MVSQWKAHSKCLNSGKFSIHLPEYNWYYHSALARDILDGPCVSDLLLCASQCQVSLPKPLKKCTVSLWQCWDHHDVAIVELQGHTWLMPPYCDCFLRGWPMRISVYPGYGWGSWGSHEEQNLWQEMCDEIYMQKSFTGVCPELCFQCIMSRYACFMYMVICNIYKQRCMCLAVCMGCMQMSLTNV